MQRSGDSNVYFNAAFEEEDQMGKEPKKRVDAARVSIMQTEKADNGLDEEETPPAPFRNLYR